MSIAWIRKNYRVPAKRGGRVEYTGDGKPEFGTICGASGSHLSIRLDGVKHTMPFHPTWELRYLDDTSTHSSPDRQPPNSICKFCARRVFEPCQSIEQAQTACTLSRPNRPGAA